MFGDIAQREEDVFLQLRIKIGFHARVGKVFSPAHKVGYSPLGAVGIVNFQTVAFFPEVVADEFQRLSRFFRQQSGRLQIAVDTVADEIIGGKIADLQNRIRYHIGQNHKTGRIV